jgi:hypothetical protein
MDDVMLASFADELTKIAANVALKGLSSSAIGKPASLTQTTKVQGTLKPDTKTTNYTVVHNYQPKAALGTADGSKVVPPPPVRA